MPELIEWLNRLEEDPWRRGSGFSPDLQRISDDLWDASLSDFERSVLLRPWFKKSQPCVFGRLAAGTTDLLSFCFLTENDIQRGDEHVRTKIQRHRLDWKRKAFGGEKSGFIVLALSPHIAQARLDETTLEFARRLAMLYLQEDIERDRIHHEHIFRAEGEGRDQRMYEWKAGVNVFSAQADKRWWHDHRIPGGLGFSVNSVGQMVSSELAREALLQQGNQGARQGHSINSLGVALHFAMRTIDQAAETVSGKATSLVPLDEPCTCNFHVNNTGPYAQKDCKRYLGWYHTDATLPTIYFRPDVERPAEAQQHSLDFTYLHPADINNPDTRTMGEGVQVR